MKFKYLLLPVLMSGLLGHAQSLTPTVVASSGEYFTGSAASLSWTLGEVVTETFTNTSNQLTQGFQQPEVRFSELSELTSDIQIQFYPNPASSFTNLTIDGTSDNLRLLVYSASGTLVYEDIYLAGETKKIALDQFANGVYLLEILTSNSEKLKTIQFIKQ